VSMATLKTRPIKGLLVLLASIAVFFVASVLLFNIFGLWIDVLYPASVMAMLYISVTIYRYVTEWKKRLLLEGELDIAKKIQESFLPKGVPDIEGLDIAASMFTARQVGGDLYDFVRFRSDRIGVMIGDVSGKGVPASLFMAMVTGAFKFFATAEARPEEVLSKLNSKLVNESASSLFVTMFYLLFDMKNFTVAYSNGGHLPVIHMKKGEKKMLFLDVSEGTPLGLMEGPYGADRADFKKGDIFVFYTDGITEAMNSKSELYESKRLINVIESRDWASSAELIEAIEKDVRRFEPKSRQHDDMTVIVIRIG